MSNDRESELRRLIAEAHVRHVKAFHREADVWFKELEEIMMRKPVPPMLVTQDDPALRFLDIKYRSSDS